MKPPKVLLTGSNWFGDLLKFCKRGLQEAGADVQVVPTNQAEWLDGATRFRRKVARMPIVGKHFEWQLSQNHLKRLQVELQQRISSINKQWQPDMLLSILCWGEPITEEMLDVLSGSRNIMRVAWLMDDPFQHDGRLAGLMAYYDRIYVVDGSWEDPVRLLTGRPTTELTCGADLQSYHQVAESDVPSEFRCGIAFVGSSYRGSSIGSLRSALLERVADLRLRVYGDQGWVAGKSALADCYYHGGELSSEQANLAYNGAEIALNIHHPQFRSGTSLRTFAIGAAGTMQMADWRPGLDRFYEPDKEIVTYRTMDELREKADYYLANHAARQRIARAGYERTRREHTYAHRLAQVLREAGLLHRNQPVRNLLETVHTH